MGGFWNYLRDQQELLTFGAYQHLSLAIQVLILT